MVDTSTVLETFWWPLLTALGISLCITPAAIKLAWKLGMVDNPSTHKHPKVTHTYPVPRGGGVSILLALVVATSFWLPFDQHIRGILVAAVFTVLVGLADDKWNISPYLRLFANFITAVIVVASGIGIAFITNPLGGVIDLSHPQLQFMFLGEMRSIWFIADLFAILWIMALMNIVGMGAGGIEGQLPGVVSIAAIVIAILSLQFSADITQWPVISLAAITAGAYLGFLPWNFFPQQIMPGYSAKSLGGFLLATLAILSTAKVGVSLVVLGLPFVDVAWAIIRRLKAGQSPVWGDRGHLHHRLLDAGLNKPQIVILYWSFTAVLGLIALSLNSQQKLYTIVAVGTLVGILLIWLPTFTTSSKKPVPDSGSKT